MCSVWVGPAKIPIPEYPNTNSKNTTKFSRYYFPFDPGAKIPIMGEGYFLLPSDPHLMGSFPPYVLCMGRSLHPGSNPKHPGSPAANKAILCPPIPDLCELPLCQRGGREPSDRYARREFTQDWPFQAMGQLQVDGMLTPQNGERGLFILTEWGYFRGGVQYGIAVL